MTIYIFVRIFCCCLRYIACIHLASHSFSISQPPVECTLIIIHLDGVQRTLFHTPRACADSLWPLCGAVLCVLCWLQSCSWWWSSTFRGRSSRRRGSLTAQTRPVQSQHSILPTKLSGPITTAQSPMAMSLVSVLRGSKAAVGPGVSPEQKLGRSDNSVPLNNIQVARKVHVTIPH